MAVYLDEYLVRVSDGGNGLNISNYGFLSLLQEAGGKASASVGYGPENMKKIGYAWIVINWKLKVFSRPAWGEKVIIKTWPKSCERCYSYREFELYDERDNLIAIASSRWVLVNINTHSISRVPEEMKERYSSLDKSLFEGTIFSKVKEPEISELTFEYTVQRRDLDVNMHVNNTNYILYAYEALPEEVYNSMKFSNVEITYKHEAALGAKISCFYTKTEEGHHIITIKNKETNVLHAIIKLYP